MKKFFMFNNTKICYYTFGDQTSKPILFLHGWATNSTLWMGEFKQFSKENFLVFIDFPPFGNSGDLKTAWDLQTYTNCVIYLIEKLNLHYYSIVAHSFGFRIALCLCLKQQQNINKVVSICGAGIEKKSFKTKCKIALYKMKKFFVKCKIIKQSHLLNCGSSDYANLSPTLKQTFKNIVNCSLQPYLTKINNMVLLLYASDDEQISVKQAKTYNKKLINSQLFLFENGGHFLFLSQKSAIINAIKIFFKEGF